MARGSARSLAVETERCLPLAGDEAVDEAAELFAHLDVEALGAVEGVARLHRVVACHVERALDRAVAGGDAAHLGELLLVDRLPEQVAELR